MVPVFLTEPIDHDKNYQQIPEHPGERCVMDTIRKKYF